LAALDYKKLHKQKELMLNISSKAGTIFWLLVIMVGFALNSIITRYLVVGDLVHPYTLTTIRFISGFLMLHIIISLAPRRFPPTGGKKKSRYIPGAILLGIYAFSISYGYSFITASAGVLVFFTFVVITMSLFSVIADKKKITYQAIMGQLLGIMGVFLIMLSDLESVSLLGFLLMALTGVAWGTYSAKSRKFSNSFAYTYNTFLLFGVISLLMLPLGHLFSGKSFWECFSLTTIVLMLCLGMITTALSYALWHNIMKKIHAFQGGIAQLIVPVLTACMGILLLGEEIDIFVISGGVSVLTGIGLNIFRI